LEKENDLMIDSFFTAETSEIVADAPFEASMLHQKLMPPDEQMVPASDIGSSGSIIKIAPFKVDAPKAALSANLAYFKAKFAQLQKSNHSSVFDIKPSVKPSAAKDSFFIDFGDGIKEEFASQDHAPVIVDELEETQKLMSTSYKSTEESIATDMQRLDNVNPYVISSYAPPKDFPEPKPLTSSNPSEKLLLLSQALKLKDSRTQLLETKIAVLQKQLSNLMAASAPTVSVAPLSSSFQLSSNYSRYAIWLILLWFSWLYFEYRLCLLYSPAVIPM
jgi:hypothetical protein